MPPATTIRPTTDIIEVLEWCRDQGAVHIKVGDVEVAFPPPYDLLRSAPGGTAAITEQAPAERPGPLPPPRNALDDPDMYASEQERWFRARPVGRV